MKARSLAVALGLALITGGAAHADAQAVVPLDLDAVELAELAPGVWMHTSYADYPGGLRVPSNGLVVRDGDSLLLIDTAWGELRTAALLARLERDIELPVRRALLTHAHGDRLAGADLLRARGVEVLATPTSRRIALENGLPLPSDVLAGLEEAGSAVQLGAVEVFYPGAGHAPDNLMVWIPDARILFGGCAVRARTAPNLGNVAHADLPQWQGAIERAADRYKTATLIVPGHGAPGDLDLLRHTRSLLRDTTHPH